MKAVILAGGEGVRLRPLTCTVPKPMLRILGRPVLEWTLEHLARQGVEDAYLALGYLPQRVMEHFGGEYAGVRLRYALEEQPLGTAGCVGALRRELTESFLVISGDGLTDADLSAAVRAHRERGAEATVVLKSVERPVEYGIAALDGQGRITRFGEKPGWGEVFSDLANTGMYILEPSVLESIPGEGSYDFSSQLFPAMLEQGRALFGWQMQGYWCDIGAHGDYLAAQQDLLTGRCSLPLPGSWALPGILLAPGARLPDEGELVAPCYIGAGVELAPGAVVEQSILEDGVRVLRGARVKRSLLGAGSCVGRRAQVRGAILDRECSVRAAAEVYEGAVAAEGAVIGAYAHVAPGARLWPGKQTEDFARVQGDVRWGGSRLSHPLREGRLVARSFAQLPPEELFAWGSACASMGPVALSHDGSALAQTVAGALAAGVSCAGGLLQPMEAENMLLHRFGQRLMGMAQGVHLKSGEEGFALCFTGAEGHDLTAGEEKRLLSALRRGRGAARDCLRAAQPLQTEPLYGASLRARFAGEGRAVVFCEEAGLRAFALRMLEAAGMEAVAAVKAPEPERAVPSGEYRARMLEAQAPMGLRLEGESWQLADEDGRLYPRETAAALLGEPETACEDGIEAFLRVYRLCGGQLARYAGEHPLPPCSSRTVPCPWERRGALARALEAADPPEEAVAVSLSESLPILRLTVRGLSQEAAEEALDRCQRWLVDRIEGKA